MQVDINEKNRALYHHGDEPDRPGYTLQELFQLSRQYIQKFQQKDILICFYFTLDLVLFNKK